MNIGDRVKVLIDDTEKLDSVDLNQMDFSNGVLGTVKGVSTAFYERAPENEVLYSVEMDNVSGIGVGRWDIPESCLETIPQEITKQASVGTLQRIQTFTMNHKNLEISFEDGKITAKDWRENLDPIEYNFDTIEQLEKFMNAWEVVGRYYNEQP